MQRNQSLPLGASLIPLVGALVLSACGGSDVPQGSEATGLGTDVQTAAVTGPGQNTSTASASASERVQALDAGVSDPVATGTSAAEPAASTTTLISEIKFEKSDWDGASFDNLGNHIQCESSISRSTSAKRAGESSIRFQTGLKNIVCPEGRYRSEVSLKTGKESNQTFPWDDPAVNWVGLSIYPRTFDNAAYTLLQIHAPNETDNCDFAGNAVTIKPEKIDGKMYYALYVILDGSKVRERNGSFSGTTRVWKEPMDKTRFTDFVVSFTLSTKKQGTTKLWRNGELVYSGSGLTNVNYIDSCGKPITVRKHNGPHVGIYGPPATGNSKEAAKYGNPYREVFIDQLRTARGPNGYALVDPSH